MDQPAHAMLSTTRLTIVSILLTAALVQSIPLLPYGQEAVRDLSQRFSPSSASSSSSSSVSSSSSPSDSSSSRVSLTKEDLADLGGLSPQEASLLALSLLLEIENSRAARAPRHHGNRASTSVQGNVYQRRPSKRFDFGFAGLENIDHILSSMRQRQAAGGGSGGSDYDKIRTLMMQAG